ncbi:MAG: hypothetical protein QM723_14220 [Myxococcaceae bacterium]
MRRASPMTAHGALGGQTLQPKSVLTFQLDVDGRTDLMLALYEVGGGCELLEQLRPASAPAQLWIDVSSIVTASSPPPVPVVPASSAPPWLPLAPHTAFFWPKADDLCAPHLSNDATVNLDQPRGELKGTFELVFADGTLKGTIDATPCGAPQLFPDPCR